MVAAIQENSEGSVLLRELLQFPRVKKLVAQSFEKRPTWPQIEKLVGASLGT